MQTDNTERTGYRVKKLPAWPPFITLLQQGKHLMMTSSRDGVISPRSGQSTQSKIRVCLHQRKSLFDESLVIVLSTQSPPAPLSVSPRKENISHIGRSLTVNQSECG